MRRGGRELIKLEEHIPERAQHGTQRARREQRADACRYAPESLGSDATHVVVVVVREGGSERFRCLRQERWQQVGAHSEQVFEPEHCGVTNLPRRLTRHHQQRLRHLRRRGRCHWLEQHRERLRCRLANGCDDLITSGPIPKPIEREYTDEPEGAVLQPLRTQLVAHPCGHAPHRTRRGRMRAQHGAQTQRSAVSALPTWLEE